jgi:uncharacterized protein (TIGR03085 family)
LLTTRRRPPVVVYESVMFSNWSADRALASAERDILCQVLIEAGPEAPTLCTGWTAHDLAIHVWQLRFDPLSLPGQALTRFAGVTAARAEAVERRWPFAELVRRIGHGWGFVPVFGPDMLHHLGEYYVHAEDVRRPAGLPARAPAAGVQDALARRLPRAAKSLFRRHVDGVVLQRADTGESMRVRAGAETVTITGTPAELMVFVYRRRAADVRVGGDEAAVQRLLA